MNELELKTKVEKQVAAAGITVTRTDWDAWWPDRLDWQAGKSFKSADVNDEIEEAMYQFGGVNVDLSIKAETRETKIELPQSHRRRSDEVAAEMEPKAARFRHKVLGLKELLKRAEIKTYLEKLKPVKADEVVILKYATDEKYYEAVTVAGPNTPAKNKPGKLQALKREVEMIARRTGWHEGQATNFVLAGEIPILSYLTVTEHFISGRTLKQPSVTITVHDLNIPAKDVRAVYLKARDELLAEYSGPGEKERKRKPKEQSERVATLIDFVANCPPKMKWEERLSLWNKKYGRRGWKYASAGSMTTAHHQAKKR